LSVQIPHSQMCPYLQHTAGTAYLQLPTIFICSVHVSLSCIRHDSATVL
jgi:hypothetical protein